MLFRSISVLHLFDRDQPVLRGKAYLARVKVGVEPLRLDTVADGENVRLEQPRDRVGEHVRGGSGELSEPRVGGAEAYGHAPAVHLEHRDGGRLRAVDRFAPSRQCRPVGDFLGVALARFDAVQPGLLVADPGL